MPELAAIRAIHPTQPLRPKTCLSQRDLLTMFRQFGTRDSDGAVSDQQTVRKCALCNRYWGRDGESAYTHLSKGFLTFP